MKIQTGRYLDRRVINGARKTLAQQLDNPRTSDDHKAKIRKLLEDLEEAVATSELQRVKLIGLQSLEAHVEQTSNGRNGDGDVVI